MSGYLYHDGRTFAIYPIAWCPTCGAERPCAGPYCQVCGHPCDGETP